MKWYLDLQINAQCTHWLFYWIKYIFVGCFSMLYAQEKKLWVWAHVYVWRVSPLTFLEEGCQHTKSKKNVHDINDDTQRSEYNSPIGGYSNWRCTHVKYHYAAASVAASMTKYYENTPQWKKASYWHIVHCADLCIKIYIPYGWMNKSVNIFAVAAKQQRKQRQE